jgi:predicted Rossmann-fold nucleotide-binding protein
MITSKDFKDIDGIIDWLDEVPYNVTRHSLYNANDLYQGYEPSSDAQADMASYSNCYDGMTYQYYLLMGKNAQNVIESLARTIHDHSIHVALDAFLANHDGRRCVGVMGGHAMLRTDPMYSSIVMLSKRLTEEGFCMLTGGGPGAMEATHLGAWMAGRPDEEVNDALKMLTVAPCFKDQGWLASAFKVMRRYPQSKYESLGVSTWLYGHEPSTPFASHIAKFFENSIREDSILTMAFGGIIYTPGSAGTMQEIFQDAVQNHYLSFGFASPMIFWGKKFWTEEMPVYPLLQHLLHTGRYKNLLLTLTDDAREIEASLKKFAEGV